MKEIQYLAIDPGETSGYATFDDEGLVIDFDQFKQHELLDFLQKFIASNPHLKHVVIEEYVNYGWKEQKRWTKNETSKVIAKIELMCDLAGVSYTRQAASCRPIGYMWAGMTQPKNHAISHQYDAYAHGVYWLQKNGVRPVGKNLIDQEKKND